MTRYASMEDGIYVAGGGECAVLDPTTGRRRAAFPFDPVHGRPTFVADIRVADDVVLVAAAREKVRAIEKGLWDASTLVALDRSDGRLLWQRQAGERFNNNAIAMAKGVVFCVDSLTPVESPATKSRAANEATATSTILALDARSGAIRWSKTIVNPYRTYREDSWTALQAHDDWLAYSRELDVLLVGKGQKARAFEARNGRVLWQSAIGGGQPCILRGASFLQQAGAMFDTRTGKPTGVRFTLGQGGCNYTVGSEHLLLFRDQSASYVDLATGAKHSLFAVRSGCSNSLIAADGVLNVPCFAVGCICNYPIQTSFAMFHLSEAAAWENGR